jgi:hypothetical protein
MRAALEQIVGRLGVSDFGTLSRDTTLQWCVQVFWRLSGVVVLMVLSRKLSAADIGVFFFALSVHGAIAARLGGAELTSSADRIGRVPAADDHPSCSTRGASLQLRGLRVRQRCWPAPCYFCRAGHSASTVVICNYGVQRRTMP